MSDEAFEWEKDYGLRERDVTVRERETALKARQALWTNPLAIAVFAAALAATGNAVVAYINGNAQTSLERDKADNQLKIEEAKAEAGRILEVIRTADPDKAAENLDFLLKAGLITDANRRAKLEAFLRQRQPGQGPSTPPSVVELPRTLTQAERQELLGGPEIQQGDKGEPTIATDDPWYQANIVTIDIPQLRGLAMPNGGSFQGQVQFHRAAALALAAVFMEIEAKGLKGDIRSFEGTLAKRVVRGSLRTLSAHALGIAIDLNARWNAYGAPPAAEGTEGSLMRIAPIFEAHGFVWGGRGAPYDSMHFEFADRAALKDAD